MSRWHVEFLERCAEGEDVALGEGNFAPGPALWVGKREVAHFDGDHTLDVRLTRSVIRDRRPELAADPRVTLRTGTSDWLEIEVGSDDDREWACSLVHDAVVANRPTAPPGLPPQGAELERRRRFH